MFAAALAAFAAGVFVLQQQASLLAQSALAAGLIATGALGAAAWRIRKRSVASATRWLVAAALLALALVLGFVYAAWLAHDRMGEQRAFADEGRDIRVVGVIGNLPVKVERGVRFEFDVEQIDEPGLRVPRRLSLAWYSSVAAVLPGERWAFTVRLRRPHGTFNPGGFDLEAWLLERRLRASGYVRDERQSPPQRLAPMVWSAQSAVDRARAELRQRPQAKLAQQRFGGILIALVLGDQRAIAEADWQLFNRTGISHLVSISGLHITMIAGLVALIVGALWRGSMRTLAWAPAQTAAAIAAMVSAFSYCLLAGWGVPAQRTFFMLAVVALAVWLRLDSRPFATLALAAFVVCLLDPWAVIAPGFWLSFGAVAAILMVVSGRGGKRKTGWRQRLREAGRVQLAVTLALVPLTVLLFRQIAVMSIVANSVAIPVVSLVVTPLALLAGFFVLLPEPLSSLAIPCLAFAHALLVALHAFLAWLSAADWTLLTLPAPPWWTLALALLGVGWLLTPPGWPLRWAGAVWLLPMLIWPAACPDSGELWVTALDVGQGTAILIESKEHTLLYDTGPRFSGAADAGGRIVLPYLRWRGIRSLDLLVVSHLDSDHSVGAAAILRGTRVERVLTSIDSARSALTSARRVQRCEADQQLELGELRIEILRPLAADYDRRLSTNAMSCVVRVTLGACSVLLSGDLPAREEAELVSRHSDLAVTLLAAPHHGSRTSSSPQLLDATRPTWASVQAGYRNRFGHPDAQVLARYLARGVHVVRSDEAGAAQWRFRSDGAVQLHRWRASAHRYWNNLPSVGARPDSQTPEVPERQELRLRDEPASIEAGADLGEPLAPY